MTFSFNADIIKHIFHSYVWIAYVMLMCIYYCLVTFHLQEVQTNENIQRIFSGEVLSFCAADLVLFQTNFNNFHGFLMFYKPKLVLLHYFSQSEYNFDSLRKCFLEPACKITILSFFKYVRLPMIYTCLYYLKYSLIL